MLREETRVIQQKLVEYCRMNNEGEIEGTRQDRLHNYRRLIYTIYWDALSDAYPIAKSILKEDQWDKMVDDFISECACNEPQLFRMPYSLIGFAEHKSYAEAFSLPYLLDLLLFEWIEIEVHSMKDLPEKTLLSITKVEDGHLEFNPYFSLIKLNYPIHQLKKQNIDQLKGEYFLLIYREKNGTVQYMELNGFTANLIEQLSANSAELTLTETLNHLFTDLKPNLIEELTTHAINFCFSLEEKGIILGFKNEYSLP